MRLNLKKIFRRFWERSASTGGSRNTLLITGWEASGSTFIYQAAKLMGINVSKSHGFEPSDKYFLKLFTIRDSRDIIN